MELTHQLTPQLKRLRLSGVLESLELRNQQAIQDKFVKRQLERDISDN